MKKALIAGAVLSIVSLFAWVLPVPHLPISQDSSVPNSSTLERPNSSTFMVNAPLLILQTPGGGEVRLDYGTDVTTKFFGSDQFAQVGLNLADRTLDRAMVEAVRAAGNDTNVNISGDGHSATLKPGQTVYYGVILTESGMAKADAVTFVLKTVPISGVPDITNNYFTIKYAELIGGGTSLGDINVRDDSTSGKAFQVIRPAGNRLFFFAFTAVARTGGIRTTIENHFFQGPAITAVTPNLLLSGCNELKTPLLDVPKLVYNCWYGGYYVDPQLLCRFKNDLAAKLKCNTDPYVAVDGEPSPNVYTVRIEGKQLPVGLEPSNVLIGNMGDTEVLQVVESAIDHVTVRVKFLRTATGPLAVSLLTPEGTLTSNGLVRAAKMISDVPDTAPGELKFDGFRIVGVPDVVKICQRVDGTHILYAKPIYQIYNITDVCIDASRTALTTVTTGGDCLNGFTNGEQGGSVPGLGPMTTSAILPDHPGPVLACTMLKGNFAPPVDLLVIHNGLEGASGGQEIPEGDDETKKGAFTVANKNDTDGDGRVDKDETETSVKAYSTAIRGVAKGDSATVEDAKNFIVGDRVVVLDQDDREYEPVTISKIEGNKITFSSNLRREYKGGKVRHGGRDELDLMKLILKKPNPDTGGNATLTVSGNTNIKIWKISTKGKDQEVKLTRNSVDIGTKDLPVTWWVEGLEKSTSVRDTVLTLSYNGESDTVKATFIWADKTNFRNTGTTLSPDADGELIKLLFEKNFDSKLGPSIGPVQGVITGVEMEFTVYPTGIGKEADIVFDITRQKEYVAWNLVGTNLVINASDEFPADEEKPNDDPGTTSKDEDNVPTNDHIYSIDGPGYQTDMAFADKAAKRHNFYEFVRVRIGGSFIDPNNEAVGNTIQGSRCSEKLTWRSIVNVKRSDTGNKDKFVFDNTSSSSTVPVLVRSQGSSANGTMSAVTTDDEATFSEDWIVTYNGTNWDVLGSYSDMQTTKAQTGTAYSSPTGGITFTITAGAVAFKRGDQFTFTTSRARENEVEEEHKVIGDKP